MNVYSSGFGVLCASIANSSDRLSSVSCCQGETDQRWLTFPRSVLDPVSVGVPSLLISGRKCAVGPVCDLVVAGAVRSSEPLACVGPSRRSPRSALVQDSAQTGGEPVGVVDERDVAAVK